MGGRFLCCFWAEFAAGKAVPEIHRVPKSQIRIVFLTAGLLVHSARCLRLLPPGICCCCQHRPGVLHCEETAFPSLYFGDPPGRRRFAVLGGEQEAPALRGLWAGCGGDARGCNSWGRGDAAPQKGFPRGICPMEDAADQVPRGVWIRAGLFPKS